MISLLLEDFLPSGYAGRAEKTEKPALLPSSGGAGFPGSGEKQNCPPSKHKCFGMKHLCFEAKQ